MSEFTQFDYLLNSMLEAARQKWPAEHGYGDKRKALYAHVRELERKAAAFDALGVPAAHAQQAVATASGVNGLPEARNPQQVLKAEGEGPDATDRGNCATASPDGGPMGAGQPAAAGPFGVREGGNG